MRAEPEPCGPGRRRVLSNARGPVLDRPASGPRSVSQEPQRIPDPSWKPVTAGGSCSGTAVPVSPLPGQRVWALLPLTAAPGAAEGLDAAPHLPAAPCPGRWQQGR